MLLHLISECRVLEDSPSPSVAFVTGPPADSTGGAENAATQHRAYTLSIVDAWKYLGSGKADGELIDLWLLSISHTSRL